MQPVIGSANDTPVMVWTRADASRSATNEAQVVYSVFQNDAWPVPQPVDPDNTTADGVAKLATAPDGTLYVIYQNADTALSDNTTASEYAAAQGISVAAFSTDSMSFVSVTSLSEADVYQYAPEITVVDNIPTAVWVSNEDASDMFGQNNTNRIEYSQLIDGTWTEPKTIASQLNAVVSLAAGEINGALYIAAVTDQDNDRTTTDDSQLTLFNVVAQTAQSLCENSTALAICFTVLPDSGIHELVWANANALYAFDGSQTRTVLESDALSQGFIALADRVLMRSSEETSSNLYAIVYNGSWQAPVQITEQDSYLQSFAAAEISGTTYLVAV